MIWSWLSVLNVLRSPVSMSAFFQVQILRTTLNNDWIVHCEGRKRLKSVASGTQSPWRIVETPAVGPGLSRSPSFQDYLSKTSRSLCILRVIWIPRVSMMLRSPLKHSSHLHGAALRNHNSSHLIYRFELIVKLITDGENIIKCSIILHWWV